MYPPLCLQLFENGKYYTKEEVIKLNIVNAANGALPLAGVCSCNKRIPIIKESKPKLLKFIGEEIYCTVAGGFLEFSKFQIGCCTGDRGHGCNFAIEIQFVTKKSPFSQFKAISRPIEVGAKGPFSEAKLKQHQKTVERKQSKVTNIEEVKCTISLPNISQYEGINEMREILTKLKLQVRKTLVSFNS